MQALAAIKEPIDWPAPDSEVEDWIFAACALIFVDPKQSERARQVLRGTLGAKRVEYLLASWPSPRPHLTNQQVRRSPHHKENSPCVC